MSGYCSQAVSKPVWHIPLLCVQWKTPDDGQRNCRNCSSVLILLASCQQACMTYTVAVWTVKNSWWWTEELSELQFRPDPARKLSANLYDIYHCCVDSEKLLMMDRGTVGTAVPSWSCSQAVRKPVWHMPFLCAQWKTASDGQRNCPKHVEFNAKNKVEKLVHVVGFIIRSCGMFVQTVGCEDLLSENGLKYTNVQTRYGPAFQLLRYRIVSTFIGLQFIKFISK